MEYYYRTNDWEEIAARDPSYISVKDYRVPYAVFENEPEKTGDPARIGTELERVTEKLWALGRPGNR
jgi:hypothetical protein